MAILKNEKISAYSHGAIVPVMAAGTIALLILSGGSVPLQIVSFVYGLSAITLFTASFLYHSKKKYEDEKSIWRRLDHSAIFMLIAGTYTPMCFLYLSGPLMWSILIIQWFLVISGIFSSLFLNLPRFATIIIYLIMGWVVIVPYKTFISAMPATVLFLLVTGGISYTLGALVYAAAKSYRKLPYRKFHEIFHYFVVAGAMLHLAMVINGVGIA